MSAIVLNVNTFLNISIKLDGSCACIVSTFIVKQIISDTMKAKHQKELRFNCKILQTKLQPREKHLKCLGDKTFFAILLG